MQKMKKCLKCGGEKPNTKEYFVVKKAGLKVYLTNQCKECKRLYDKRYRIENKTTIAEQRKNYRENNASLIAERKEKYYRANRQRIIEKSKLYYKENAADISERSKKRRTEYKKNNKDIVIRQRQRRKALKRKLPATLTNEQWESIKAAFDNKCAYCGEKRSLTQEHFIPLSKGGEYTHNNIIPACGKCNSSKGNKDFFEWYPKQPFYSKQREISVLKFLNYNKNKEQQLSIL